MPDQPHAIVIAGPTAGGKSALAMGLAQQLPARELTARDRPAELISADSMQVYRGLDIGSAKPAAEDRACIPHHLIDIAEPTERFTVHDWLEWAERAIADIRARGGVPIVVGGTHLYIKALLEGLFEGPDPDPDLRAELEARPQADRRAELERTDPDAAARIHPNDQRRTVRALEVHRQTGTPISVLQQQWDRERSVRTDAALVGLDWPAEALNRRINARVKHMMELGLLDEVRGLLDAGRLGPQAREGLGYKQLAAHLEGRCTLDEAVERIKIETRRFAKNQRTWLRRLHATPGSVWIDAASQPPEAWPETVLGALDGT